MIAEITLAELEETALDRFAADREHWLFTCPSCGSVQSKAAIREAGGDPEAVHELCQLNGADGHGCGYSAAGLISGPVHVLTADGAVFSFALAPVKVTVQHVPGRSNPFSVEVVSGISRTVAVCRTEADAHRDVLEIARQHVLNGAGPRPWSRESATIAVGGLRQDPGERV